MGKVIEKYDRHSVRHRASLRGIKKCPSCGCINGQRALICCNSECLLRQQQLATLKPFDPIQLITYNNNNSKWFSVRCKEKLTNLRSFVCIPQKQQPQKQSNEIVCSTKTFCYVNSCKYDFYDAIQISCKHIRACQSSNASSSSKDDETATFQQAKVFHLDKNILWNLNITKEQKQLLWNLYQSEEKYMPAVQCLNGIIFVVKCLMTETSPAGRLHITVYPDTIARKKGTFLCGCKKLKMPLETAGSNDSLTNQNNNYIKNINNSRLPRKTTSQFQDMHCDHVLLVMAAILSQSEEKYRYNTFLNNLQMLWMPSPVNVTSPPLNRNLQSISTCDIFNEESNTDMAPCIVGDKPSPLAASLSSIQNHFTDDLFNFSDELFSDCMLPDFTDIDLDMQNGVDCSQNHSNIGLSMESKTPVNNYAVTSDSGNHGRFILSSQPQPQMNLSQVEMNDHAKCNSSQNFQKNHCLPSAPTITAIFDDQLLKNKSWDVCQNNNNNEQIIADKSNRKQQQQSLLKPLAVKTSNLVQQRQQQQQQQEIIHITTTITSAAFATAENSIKSQQQSQKSFHTELKNYKLATPTVTFENWLHHIIEVLNEAIDIKESAHVKRTFHVHEDTFSYFSNTFGLNNKRRLPNATSMVTTGKYKDFMKYSWHFTQPTTVQRIFTTKQMKFEMERLFYLNSDGSFRHYIPNISLNAKMKDSRIYPKHNLYTAFVKFKDDNTNIRCDNPDSIINNELSSLGVTIDWLPMSFPKSNYGIMSIEFCIGVRENI